MLNVALVGLLAGSLLTGGQDDRNKDRDKTAPAADAPVVAEVAPADDLGLRESLTSDTYSLGFPSAQAPIKIWAQYAYGVADQTWRPNGDRVDINIGGTAGEIITQRIGVGAQINAINLSNIQIGVGGQLNVAKNEFRANDDAGGLFTNGLESDFGLQSAKVYGVARGRVAGIHGGYHFDLGSEQEFNGPLPTNLANSDQRNAFFVGANFDYPSERVRLFGGVDYHRLLSGGAVTESDRGDDFLNFIMGAGLKLSVFEVGTALQIVTRLQEPTVSPQLGTANGIAGHARMLSPYVRISPPAFPASIFFRGAVLDEYTEYGLALDGANSIRPKIGGTVGISVGFD